MDREKLADLIRNFNPADNDRCHYCGSYMDFAEESDHDDEMLMLADEILRQLEV